jgi:hypothetical protein
MLLRKRRRNQFEDPCLSPNYPIAESRARFAA